MGIQKKQGHFAVHDLTDDSLLGVIYGSEPGKKGKLKRRLEECVEDYFHSDTIATLVDDIPDNIWDIEFRSKELSFELDFEDDQDRKEEWSFDVRPVYIY